MSLIMLNKMSVGMCSDAWNAYTHLMHATWYTLAHHSFSVSYRLSFLISFDSLVFLCLTHFVQFQLNWILMELKYGSLQTNEKIKCVLVSVEKMRVNVQYINSLFGCNFRYSMISLSLSLSLTISLRIFFLPYPVYNAIFIKSNVNIFRHIHRVRQHKVLSQWFFVSDKFEFCCPRYK